jgi:hypothetical protein
MTRQQLKSQVIQLVESSLQGQPKFVKRDAVTRTLAAIKSAVAHGTGEYGWRFYAETKFSSDAAKQAFLDFCCQYDAILNAEANAAHQAELDDEPTAIENDLAKADYAMGVK